MKHLTLTLLIVLCCGCSHTPTHVALDSSPPLAFIPTTDNRLVSKFAPIFTSENSFASFNKVGTVKARIKNRHEEVYIDASHPSFYFLQRDFVSTRGSHYTNLIYRIHFEKVPHSLIPFHLTAGKNGGLILVITLNEKLQPVLITSIHSCGCYLGFTPTSFLANSAFPDDWNWEKNRVYGEELPVQLQLSTPFNETFRPLIQVRNGTHRVMGIDTIDLTSTRQNHSLIEAQLLPMDALKNLPIADNTHTSFFHEQGWQKGYVKGATKPYELLLMSWWTLDLFVGRDKEYGPHDETGAVFYTSLKPWQRKASDMWPFEKFLDFWGWKL